MKTLIVIIFALGLTVINKPAYLSNMDINDNKIKVVFDENMKFNDLVAVKLKLESRNIHMTYDNLIFDRKGYLKELSYDYKSKNEKQKLVIIDKTSEKIAFE